MADLSSWRAEFPILANTTYLNSCSLGAMPRSVPDSVGRFVDLWREKGTPAWEDWFEEVTSFRRSFAEFIGAKTEEVAITHSVSAGMSSIASALSFKGERNKVVFTEQEFPSSVYLWQKLRDQGAVTDVVPSKDRITVPIEAWKGHIDHRTLIVPTSHAFFRTGYIQDAKALADICHDKGAYLFLDNYQSLGVIPCDVKRLDVDMAIGGVLKWCCGGPGVIFLYVREGLIRELQPRMMGWLSTKDPFAFQLEGWSHADDATRFTFSTPPVPALYTARPGFEIIKKVGMDAIRPATQRLSDHVVRRAEEHRWKVNSPTDSRQRTGIVTVDVPDAERVYHTLVHDDKVIVDYRPGAGIRVAPHFYNTTAEVDHFFERAAVAVTAKGAPSAGPRRF